jgi:hypothetical protein
MQTPLEAIAQVCTDMLFKEHCRMGAPYFVTSAWLFRRLLEPQAPLLFDVRRSDIIAQSGQLIPQARIADHGDGPSLLAGLDRNREIIVACAHGHNRSQRLAAFLRSEGYAASALQDGYDGWSSARLPLVSTKARGVELGQAPTLWVTRRKPKIDRIACPWLITRFLDPRARFLFVDPDWVLDVAASEGGISYDLPGGLFEHEGELCSFDILLREFGLDGFAPLSRIAAIIRGADTNRAELAPQSAGLLAISLGLSARHHDDDHELLKEGFVLYDGLLSWAIHASDESHNWPRAQVRQAP